LEFLESFLLLLLDLLLLVHLFDLSDVVNELLREADCGEELEFCDQRAEMDLQLQESGLLLLKVLHLSDVEGAPVPE
jgi:hypothetical protein